LGTFERTGHVWGMDEYRFKTFKLYGTLKTGAVQYRLLAQIRTNSIVNTRNYDENKKDIYGKDDGLFEPINYCSGTI
jgi:hypothetical protein